MNDELKEILDRIETASEIFDCLLKPEECTELLDYITNLQQRCEYLERSNDRREDTILGLRQEIYEQEDYKSRCEKASDKIKKIRENAIKYGADHDAVICDDLLNILQGENNGN